MRNDVTPIDTSMRVHETKRPARWLLVLIWIVGGAVLVYQWRHLVEDGIELLSGW